MLCQHSQFVIPTSLLGVTISNSFLSFSAHPFLKYIFMIMCKLRITIQHLLRRTTAAHCSIHINTHTPLELEPLGTVVAAAAGSAWSAERAARYSSTALRSVRFCLRRLCRSGRVVKGDLHII